MGRVTVASNAFHAHMNVYTYIKNVSVCIHYSKKSIHYIFSIYTHGIYFFDQAHIPFLDSTGKATIICENQTVIGVTMAKSDFRDHIFLWQWSLHQRETLSLLLSWQETTHKPLLDMSVAHIVAGALSTWVPGSGALRKGQSYFVLFL